MGKRGREPSGRCGWRTARPDADLQGASPWRDGVLADDDRLDEVQEVVGPARLGAVAGEPVAAERLAADHRAGGAAVDVEVADRGAAGDGRDRRRVAREEAAGQRLTVGPRPSRRRPRRAATGSTLSTGPKISSLTTGALVGSSATTARRGEEAAAARASRRPGRRGLLRRRPAGPSRSTRSRAAASISGGTSIPKVGLADQEGLEGAAQALGQRLGDALVDQQPRGRRALLAGVPERRGERRRGRRRRGRRRRRR